MSEDLFQQDFTYEQAQMKSWLETAQISTIYVRSSGIFPRASLWAATLGAKEISLETTDCYTPVTVKTRTSS